MSHVSEKLCEKLFEMMVDSIVAADQKAMAEKLPSLVVKDSRYATYSAEDR